MLKHMDWFLAAWWHIPAVWLGGGYFIAMVTAFFKPAYLHEPPTHSDMPPIAPVILILFGWPVAIVVGVVGGAVWATWKVVWTALSVPMLTAGELGTNARRLRSERKHPGVEVGTLGAK